MKKTSLSFVSGVFCLVLAFVFNEHKTYATGKEGYPTGAFHLANNITVDDYLAQTIVVRVKQQFQSSINAVSISNGFVQNAFNELQVTSFDKRFPYAKPPASDFNSWGAKMVDLSPIYELHYAATIGIEAAINRLIALGVFEYVEPRYIDRVNYTPNDPSIGNSGQYFLTNIKAFQAWDIIKGDTNVVIGIVDSGTDTAHTDLAPNIKINYADPINGIDDDGDGYIDNNKGWDVSEQRRTVQAGVEHHGVWTSGDADAATDNSIGVASPGFKCKYLPVKSTHNASSGTIDNGYDGIIYAGDHHCNIINCSWGGPGFSQAAQDVINYASINDSALVVCSAGNNNTSDIQYPAAYNYVLCVASTGPTDAKSGFSSFGSWVKISAPGENIYSTNWNGASTHNYSYESGTSMASPITAGAAAIVKSRFPNYNNMQVKAQLLATADNIDAVNAGYIGQLGTGRVNMYRAVTETNHESVDMVNIVAHDLNDDIFVIGDTLRITGDIMNYLSATTNLTVTMTCSDPNITVLTPNTLNVGALTTMQTYNNGSTPFTARINPGTPNNLQVSFVFTFHDGSYTSTASFTTFVNVNYLNIQVNDIATTVTSKALMAYNDPDLGTRAQGLGFAYLGNSMTYEIGLMIGTDASHVDDNVRTASGNTVNNGFAIVNAVRRMTPSPIGADFDGRGTFDDHTAPTPLNITVNHKALAWSSACDRKYVIVEYAIHNTGASVLNNVYAGIFSDWDIGSGGVPDKADVDRPNRMGYVYETTGAQQYAGIRLLTSGGFNNYSIDNDSTGATGVHVYQSFTNAEKWTTLSTSKDQAGTGSGTDVSQVVSTGPLTINPGDSAVVAFALMAGDDLPNLISTANAAQNRYNNFSEVCTIGVPVIEGNAASLQIFPNPASKSANFNFTLKNSSSVTLTIYDAVGDKIKEVVNKTFTSGSHSYHADLADLAAGTYYVEIRTNETAETQKLMIIK